MRETLKSECFTWNIRAISVKLGLVFRINANVSRETFAKSGKKRLNDLGNGIPKNTQKTHKKTLKKQKSSQWKVKNGSEHKKTAYKNQKTVKGNEKAASKHKKKALKRYCCAFLCFARKNEVPGASMTVFLKCFTWNNQETLKVSFFDLKEIWKNCIFGAFDYLFLVRRRFFDEFCEIVLCFLYFLPLRYAKMSIDEGVFTLLRLKPLFVSRETFALRAFLAMARATEVFLLMNQKNFVFRMFSLWKHTFSRAFAVFLVLVALFDAQNSVIYTFWREFSPYFRLLRTKAIKFTLNSLTFFLDFRRFSINSWQFCAIIATTLIKNEQKKANKKLRIHDFPSATIFFLTQRAVTKLKRCKRRHIVCFFRVF